MYIYTDVGVVLYCVWFLWFLPGSHTFFRLFVRPNRRYVCTSGFFLVYVPNNAAVISRAM